MFTIHHFSTLLKSAASALDEACDLLQTASDQDVAAPGPKYLLARIETALQIIEAELPEFRDATVLSVLDSLGQ